MSEKKDGNMPKRFFVAGTEELFKQLKILAIQMDEGGAEKLGGKLLAEAVQRLIAEQSRKQAKPERR